MTTSLNKQLRRWRMTYLAPLERRAAEAWSWWIGELVAMLPDRLRTSLAAARQQTFLQLSGSEVVVFHGSIERMQEIGKTPLTGTAGSVQVPADSRSVVLLLPPGQILCSTITLPAATEENLREVLTFEMDRQTPFTADQVYFDSVIRDRSAQGRTIDIELIVSPRDRLDKLLASLSELDLAPDVVSARRDASSMYDVNLLPPGKRQSRPAALDRLNLGLGIACVILLVVAIAVPVIQKQQSIRDLEPQVAAAMDAAREGARLRDNIERIVESSRILVDKKRSAPMVMQFIDEMTRVIPDGTWISQLNIQGREIQVQGQSPAAASLIGLIEESASFTNPQFRSPVTQVPRSNLERFHLSADWAGAGDP